MTGGHPAQCPELGELAGMLGLGLSAPSLDLLVPTDQSLDEILTWVEDCPSCSASLETLEAWQDEVGYPDLAVVANERNRALELWEDLAGVATEDLPENVGEKHLFWAMSQLLQKRSREANRVSTSRAVMLAELAVNVADLLDPATYTPRLLADLRARARAYLGNALRVAGRLSQADAAFEGAQVLVERGTGSVLARAVVLDFLGSLRKDQRRIPEAVEVLTAAALLYEAAGRPDLVAKVNLNLGNAEDLRGNLEAAVAHLTEAQKLIDPATETRLYSHCQHQLIYYLTEAGYFEEAELRIPLVRRLYQQADDTTNLLRLRWVEGRVAQGQMQVAQARAVFREVADGLGRIGQQADVGFILLDLACLECSEGKFDVVKALASEAYAIFRRAGATHHCLAAISAFQQAADAEVATVDLIRSLARYLVDPSRERHQAFQPLLNSPSS